MLANLTLIPLFLSKLLYTVVKSACVHSAPSPAVYHLKSPFTYSLTLPLSHFLFCFFYPASPAIWRKRDGAGKSELSELPKRHESYESYKGDVTLNKSPHHGMPYIYTRPGGMRALMSPSLCFRLCLTLSLSEPQLHVKQCQCPHHRPEGMSRPKFAFLSLYFP